MTVPHWGQSLWLMAVVLFVEGGSLSFLTTPTLLYYGKFHAPWVVGVIGSVASAAGSAVQLLILRWALSEKHAWMTRFAPSRAKVEEAIARVPSASFMALLIARATPLPDAPLKIVAAVAEYPVLLYTLAVLLGSLPYFYALALFGHEAHLPVGWLVGGSLALLAVGVAIDRIRAMRAKR